MREWIIQAETIGNISDGYWYGNGEEIVRCKDCKHSDECHKTVQYTRRENRTTMMLGSMPVEYCSWGERKDDVSP